jgi:cell division protein ZapA (FtsZ GTPase activity inhibitor)
MGKKGKKRTPEERAALEAHSEDLDRRLREMIERYRKLNAEKRAFGAS